MIGQCSIPPPQQSDPVGPLTAHFNLIIINFHTRFISHVHFLCAKLFAKYACSRDQLGGVSDSLVLGSSDGRLKSFCRHPCNSPRSVHNLPSRSGEYKRSSIQVCLYVHSVQFLCIVYMALIGCMYM